MVHRMAGYGICHRRSAGSIGESIVSTLNDPRKPLRTIKVGVFPPEEGSRTYMAYTRWYNPQWPRCCEHEVEAINGTEAKKIAIKEHKERCEGNKDAE